MTLSLKLSTAAAVLFLAFSGVSHAQEIAPEHLKQARGAISAIGATNQFDDILLQLGQALKSELIQKDPNLQALITSTVDNEVLTLAERRADLENEAGRVYAKVFNIDELKAISEFYATPAGKKLLSDGPLASRQLIEAANIWQSGVARDLAQQVSEKMKSAAPSEVDIPVAAPAEVVKPAESQKQ
jgi:uncharacterized protein